MLFFCRLLLAAAWTACSLTARGQELIEADVANSRILIPAPKGYVEVGQLAPEIQGLAKAVVAPQMRLLAAFSKRPLIDNPQPQGLEPSKRYYVAQALRVGETQSFDEKSFATIKAEVLRVSVRSLKEINEINRRHFEAISESLKIPGFGFQFTIVSDKTDQSERHLSMAMTSQIAAISPVQHVPTLIGQIISIVLLQDKAIHLTTMTEIRSDEDLNWLHQANHDWIRSAIALNRR